MAYKKQNFKDGEVLTAYNLSLMEDGIISKQDTSNLTTVLDESSDDTHYPSAKATYTLFDTYAEQISQEIPSKVSELENDEGYLKSYTETDPTVPAWAKTPNKPTYTAEEVGALPKETIIPDALSDLSDDSAHRTVTDSEKTIWNAKSNFSGSYNDLTDKPSIPSNVLNEDGIIKQDVLPEGYPYITTGNILPETDLSIDPDSLMAPIIENFDITSGHSYTVTWNGVEYNCIAETTSLEGISCVGLGDTGALEGQEPSGVFPFGIVKIDESYVETLGAYGIAFSLDGSTEANVSIEGSIVYKIDKAFLPDTNTLKSLVDGSMAGSIRGILAAAEDDGYTIGECAAAFGMDTKASGFYSHAEGDGTKATSSSSHAEGTGTTASGWASHAEGNRTIASGKYSHAEGDSTTASGDRQHVQGRYNIEDTANKYAHIVGNGLNSSTPSNAHTLDWDGVAWFAGDVKVGGTGQDDTNAKTLATTDYVDTKVSEIPTSDASGQINTHNTDTTAHNDIREQINELNTALDNKATIDKINEIDTYFGDDSAVECTNFGVTWENEASIELSEGTGKSGIKYLGKVPIVAGDNVNFTVDEDNQVVKINAENTTYSAAGSALGLVQSGGDVTISNGTITVNDDSHNHTIANVDGLQTALDGKANKSEGIFFIQGGGTTDTTNKVATWTGSHEGITEYYDGLMLAYKIGTAGSTTTTLNINDLGAVPVVKNATSAIGSSFAAKSVIFLVYTTDSGTAYWKAHDYDTNTKTTTGTSNKTGTKLFLVGGASQASSATTYSNSNVFIDTSDVLNSAKGFKGNLTGNADTATKATQDASGNVITSTYETKADATAKFNQLSSEIVDIGGAPEYVVTEAEEVADKVLAVRNANSFVMALASDLHTNGSDNSSTSVLHAGQGMDAINSMTQLDLVALLGDYEIYYFNHGDEDTDGEDARKSFKHAKKAFSSVAKGAPFMMLQGNHDQVSTDTTEEAQQKYYAYIGANNVGTVADYDNKFRNYGYRDFENYKIRVIYLNTADVSEEEVTTDAKVSTEQINWLNTVALNLTDPDWGIIVLSHHPLNWYGMDNLLSALDTYKGNGTGAELIAHFHGHLHNFRAETLGTNKILTITIPNACNGRENEYGTSSSYSDEIHEKYGDKDADGNQRKFPKTANSANDTSFISVVVDRENEKIHAFCYGAGIDRVIGFDGELIEDDTSGDDNTGEESEAYTNLVPKSINTDGSIYNGVGYQEGARINSSGTTTEQTGAANSGFIKYNGEVIRIYGSTESNYGATGHSLAMYDSSFTYTNAMGAYNAVNYGATWTELNGKWMLTIDPEQLTNDVAKNTLKNAKYIRCSMASCTGADFVVTLNDDLEDPTDGENSPDTPEQTYTEQITGEFLDNTRLSTSGDQTRDATGFVTTPYFDISKYPDGFTIKLSGIEWTYNGTTNYDGYAYHFSPNSSYSFIANYTNNNDNLNNGGYKIVCDSTTKEVTITTNSNFKIVYNKVRFSGKGTSANAVVQVIYTA